MEFNFTVKSQKLKLITKEEYPLFWLRDKNTALVDEIGTCKVQLLEESQISCIATITTGGVRHSINDIVVAEFKPNDIFSEKLEYSIFLKNDLDGNEYVYGFCLSS